MPYTGFRWICVLAAIILLLAATLGMAGVVAGLNLPWLFPAGVLAAFLALCPFWP